MTPDETIILRLTRENARLQLDNDLLTTEMNTISEILTALRVSYPHDPLSSVESGEAERLAALRDRITAFPLSLTDHYHQLPGEVFNVLLPNPMEAIEHYVVAKDREAVDDWLKVHYPHGFKTGYEPLIERLSGDAPGATYWISAPAASPF